MRPMLWRLAFQALFQWGWIFFHFQHFHSESLVCDMPNCPQWKSLSMCSSLWCPWAHLLQDLSSLCCQWWWCLSFLVLFITLSDAILIMAPAAYIHTVAVCPIYSHNYISGSSLYCIVLFSMQRTWNKRIHSISDVLGTHIYSRYNPNATSAFESTGELGSTQSRIFFLVECSGHIKSVVQNTTSQSFSP